jgi:hypothetical protein
MNCQDIIALAHEEYLRHNGTDARQPVRRLTGIGEGRKGFSVIFRDEEHKVLAMYDIVMKGEEVTFDPVNREQDPEMFGYFDVVEQGPLASAGRSITKIQRAFRPRPS